MRTLPDCLIGFYSLCLFSLLSGFALFAFAYVVATVHALWLSDVGCDPLLGRSKTTADTHPPLLAALLDQSTVATG